MLAPKIKIICLEKPLVDGGCKGCGAVETHVKVRFEKSNPVLELDLCRRCAGAMVSPLNEAVSDSYYLERKNKWGL